jgi:hypothetical protein
MMLEATLSARIKARSCYSAVSIQGEQLRLGLASADPIGEAQNQVDSLPTGLRTLSARLNFHRLGQMY